MRRVPRAQSLKRSSQADRTASTQLLLHSMRDALSSIFDVAHPADIVTMSSPTWIFGWDAPPLKLTEAFIHANREDTYDLYRLVDDLFLQLQERMNSRANGPAVFRIFFTDIADCFDRASRCAVLEII